MLISKLNLNEIFICSIWENSEYYSGLRTTDDREIEILDYGIRNYDAGPDYTHAKICLDGKIYTGSIEIHRDINDWYKHSHSTDPKYSEVVLHIAMFSSESGAHQSKAPGSRSIPTVILSEYLTRPLREIWQEVIGKKGNDISLKCFPSVLKLSESVKRQMILSQAVERLDGKTDKIRHRINVVSEVAGRDDARIQVLMEYLFEALGYSKNKAPFLKLARKIAFSKVLKEDLGNAGFDALLFGAAGLLMNVSCSEDYINELKTRWYEIRKRLNIDNIDPFEWNFFRMRPANFPTNRLAFASGLLNFATDKNLDKLLIEILSQSDNPVKSVTALFSKISVSEYWNHHYHFGKLKKSTSKPIGNQRVYDITVNVLIPFAIAVSTEDVLLEHRLCEIYLNLKTAFPKSIQVRWLESEIGIDARTCGDEQGMIGLYRNFCTQDRCNECEIGKSVFEIKEPDETFTIILY